jgi:protein CpxP
VGRFLQELDLTEAQRDQIRAIMEAHRPAMKPFHEELSEARQALREAAAAPAADESAIRSAASRLAAAEATAAIERAQVAAKIRTVLSPDQQKEFDAARQRLQEWVSDWPRRGHGPAWDRSRAPDDAE